MKIIFIRHGNPDYALDCLTELGHKQAEAAAEVLCTMEIDKIFASTHGRAIETAEHTANKLGFEIQGCDFIRELTSRRKDDPTLPWSPEYSAWRRLLEYGRRNLPLLDPAWRDHELFEDIDTVDCIDKLCIGLDEWLSSLGVERDGIYYRIKEKKLGTVAMFCHAMAYSAAMAYMFNLTFPFVSLAMPMPQAAITVIDFDGEIDEVIAPKILKLACVDHLKKNGIEIS